MSLILFANCFHFQCICNFTLDSYGFCYFKKLQLTPFVNCIFFFLKIKIPHPRYPSTRVSFQVPNLGLHFSPERYCRIAELLNTFYSSMGSSDQDSDTNLQPSSVPWLPADLATDARILAWRVWPISFIILNMYYIIFNPERPSSIFY